MTTTTTTEVTNDVEMLPVRSVFAPHEVRDSEKLTALTQSMERDGWQGRPLLVIEYMDGYQAITGSHRYAAAEAAGMEEIPCVLVDKAAFEAAGYSVSDLWDDETTLSIFEEIGDTRAAELMQAEIEAQ